MTHTEEVLNKAIEYADARFSGVDVPIEWVRHFADALAQPAQEPVRWWDEERDVLYRHCTHDTDDYHGFKRTVPLYAYPPQRTWVGLTEERIKEIWSKGKDHGDDWSDVLALARAFEAELKGKNNGLL